MKPMNCPGHIMIYKTRGHSYRELPLRWAELGTVYRYERSGVLHGMLRVRGFTQDDAHIFCTPEQLADEIAGVLDLVDILLKTFGYEYTAYLATRPEDKFIGSDEVWELATEALRAGARAPRPALEVDEGGGAFYGPKIDFKMQGRARPRVAEPDDPVRLQPAGALRPDLHRHRRPGARVRSWCTARSSDRSSASSGI